MKALGASSPPNLSQRAALPGAFLCWVGAASAGAEQMVHEPPGVWAGNSEKDRTQGPALRGVILLLAARTEQGPVVTATGLQASFQREGHREESRWTDSQEGCVCALELRRPGLRRGEDRDSRWPRPACPMGHRRACRSPEGKTGPVPDAGRQWLRRGHLGVTDPLTYGPALCRPSDEHHPEVKADGYVDNLAEAVDLLLQHADK